MITFLIFISIFPLIHSYPLKASQDIPVFIEAKNKIQCEQDKNVCTAHKEAQAKRGNTTLFADTLKVFFSSQAPRKIIRIEAHGHVRCIDQDREILSSYAFYEVKKGYLKATGPSLKISTPHHTLRAKTSFEYFQFESKGIALGEAIFIHPEKQYMVKADKLILFLKKAPSSKKQENTPQTLDYVIAEGNVVVSHPQHTAHGDWGRYDMTTEQALLKGHAKLIQGKNIVQGDTVHVDLKLNKAFVSSGSSEKVRAILIPKEVKKP